MRWKEQLGEGDITVLSIGPDKVKEAMKKALAMGCDRGVQVSDEAVSGKEPYQIASIVAAFAGDKNFDVIFTGMQSQDRGSGQVGVLLAEMLGMPSVTTVVDFNFDGGSVTAKRELEGGIKDMVKVATPALFTCQLGLNTPRYPTLPNIMKAKKKELLSIPVGDLLKVEPRQQTAALYFPEKKGGGLVLEGEVGDLADQLVRILKEKTTVLS
jgi:electron transfer flavoprotein beta subunit